MHTARKYLGLAAAGGEPQDRPGATAAQGGLARHGSAACGCWCLWCKPLHFTRCLLKHVFAGVGMAGSSEVMSCVTERCHTCCAQLQGG